MNSPEIQTVYRIIIKTKEKEINLGTLADKDSVLTAVSALLENHNEVTIIKGGKA